MFQKVQNISERNILTIIILIAVSLRVISALIQGNQVVDLPGVYDQISYDGLAKRVVDGYGFSFGANHWPATRAGEPTAHWSYLYTFYLAAIYSLFGKYPIIARIIQGLISGIFQPLLVYKIGTRLFKQTVGLVAAALSAVYVYFFYYAGALVTETFYIVCILWVFDTSYRIVHAEEEKFGWIRWFELGMAVAFTVLLRQLFLLVLPFIYSWIWWNFSREKKKFWNISNHWTALKGLILVTVILVLFILPFSIRNYQAFGTFVLLNTNAGFAFYWGNHPIHGVHFVPILPSDGPSYQDLIPSHLISLNEGMLDKALLREGFKVVQNDPLRYVILSLSRIPEYIKFWPSKDSGMISNISRIASFGILLPFMVYGIFISFEYFRNPDYKGQGADLGILYIFIVVYALIHILTWTLIRYRLPIDAILLIFAADGIKRLTKKYTINQSEI